MTITYQKKLLILQNLPNKNRPKAVNVQVWFGPVGMSVNPLRFHKCHSRHAMCARGIVLKVPSVRFFLPSKHVTCQPHANRWQPGTRAICRPRLLIAVTASFGFAITGAGFGFCFCFIRVTKACHRISVARLMACRFPRWWRSAGLTVLLLPWLSVPHSTGVHSCRWRPTLQTAARCCR